MNTRSLRTGVAAAVGGAVLVAGLLVGASFALAQDSGEADTSDDTSGSVEFCDRAHDRLHRWLGDLSDIAGDMGLSLDELRQELRDGATLDELAEAAGVDLEAVIAELRQEALAAIDEAAASGDLSEEQANRLKERIEAFDLGDGFPFGGRDFSLRGGDGFSFRGDHGSRLPGGFGDLLGDIDLDLLREQLEGGADLNEALENLGFDLEELANQAVEDAAARLDELVEAGRLTQERADAIKERLEILELGDGFPFGLRDLHPRSFDFELDFEGFPGPHGHGRGFGFFGGDGSAKDTIVEGALLDI